ncbi:MAG TPA: hypothetical protein VNL71_12535 [Chloroflexota bacterium]|nr:hypothetical protein [Chloroflexota bacterium]
MAGGFLLDTNVISETRKTRADMGVIAFLSGADAAQLFLNVFDSTGVALLDPWQAQI